MDKNTPFQKALLDSTLEDFSHIPGENELSGDFSPQFEKSCKKLLQMGRRCAIMLSVEIIE